jgi:hypothetical protein
MGTSRILLVSIGPRDAGGVMARIRVHGTQRLQWLIPAFMNWLLHRQRNFIVGEKASE